MARPSLSALGHWERFKVALETEGSETTQCYSHEQRTALQFALFTASYSSIRLFFFIIIICPQILLYFLVSSQNSSFVEISNKNSEAKNTNKSSYLANKQR